MARWRRFRSADWLDIPPVAQCLETHSERIDEREPAYKSFAETGDFADNFQCPKSRNPKSAAPKKRSVKSNAARMSKISMPHGAHRQAKLA
jgi:hypothetical protein